MLSVRQIEQIEEDVRQARITIINLSDELVDHICCEIEALMKKGCAFEEAYQITRQQTGMSVLQKIQENTLYLTDQKYRIMKTIMKITGNVALALMGLGATFKIFHWPGAAPMLVCGFALLCFFFFPAVVFLHKKEGRPMLSLALNSSILTGGILFMMGILFKIMHWQGASILMFCGWSIILVIYLPILIYIQMGETGETKMRRLYLTGGIGLLLFQAGTMFKMFHWPGASVLLLSGAVTLIGVFVPVYAYRNYYGDPKKYGHLVYLVTVSMYAVVLTILTALNVSVNILRGFESRIQHAYEMNQYLEKHKPMVAAMDEDSTTIKENYKQLTEIKIKEEKLTGLIDSLITELAETDNAGHQLPTETILRSPNLLHNNANIQLMNNQEPGSPTFRLEKQIIEFRELLLQTVKTDSTGRTAIRRILLTQTEQQNSFEKKDHPHSNFFMPLTALAFLTETKRNIMIAEKVSTQNLINFHY